MINFRKLTLDEVECIVETEREETDIHGYFCSDDPQRDREDEKEIEMRFAHGDDLAWCSILVTVRWNGFEATDSLGCISVADNKDLENEVDHHAMKEEALDGLQKLLEQTYLELHGFLREGFDGKSITPDRMNRHADIPHTG